MSERSLAQALARFEGFKKNIPPSIREDVVVEYHRLVDHLASATGEDLTAFKIRAEEVKHRVIGSRPGGYGGGSGSVMYSTDKYCDTSRFKAQIDALAEYLESAGHRRNAEVPPTRPSPATYHIENMYGSAIQHGTRDSRITVNYDAKSAEFSELIATIKAEVPKLGLSPEATNQLNVDIGTIEVQISGAAPRRTIITESMHSIRNILEGAVGSAIASGLLPMIYQYFPK
jgi:hypothetical protein